MLHEFDHVGLVEELFSSGDQIDAEFAQLHGVCLADAEAVRHTFPVDDGIVDVIFGFYSPETVLQCSDSAPSHYLAEKQYIYHKLDFNRFDSLAQRP